MNNLINLLDYQFASLHRRSAELIERVPDERLYWKPREIRLIYSAFSCGENILRSAAAVEQTVGGITTRLWDDPFEWTLPEALSSGEKVLGYLNEVEASRRKGFEFFRSDADLLKEIPAPEVQKPIIAVLLDTLARAENYQGRAFLLFQMFADDKLPRL